MPTRRMFSGRLDSGLGRYLTDGRRLYEVIAVRESPPSLKLIDVSLPASPEKLVELELTTWRAHRALAAMEVVIPQR